MLQAWFDESGKTNGPVFLLAGYIGSDEMWTDFSADWQRELDREPKLRFLHVKERRLFKGVSDDERTARLLRFVEIIRKYQPRGIVFCLKHLDHRRFYRIISVHPMITDPERRMMKNPYYLSFLQMFMRMLIRQAQICERSGVEERIRNPF